MSVTFGGAAAPPSIETRAIDASRRRHRTLRTLTPYLFIAPISLLMFGLLFYPIGYNILISFFNWDLRRADIPFYGLRNYIEILRSSYFFPVLINTMIWSGVGVLLQFAIGLSTALFVDNLTRMKRLVQTIMLLPSVIPGVVIALVFLWMLQSDLGIVNHVLWRLGIIDDNILWFGDERFALSTVILINTWKACRFWFLMLIAGLQNLPQDQVESARIDGARYPAILRHVILPHLAPIIAATGVITTIWTLNRFDLIWVTTKGGPLTATSTLPIYTYRLAFEFFDFGQSAALAVISLMVILIVASPYLRSTMKSLIGGDR